MKKTNECLVLEEKEKRDVFKNEFSKQLKKFASLDDSKKIKNIDDLHKVAVSFFNRMEGFVADSGYLGAHSNEQWVLKLGEDCHSVLDTILIYYSQIKVLDERTDKNHNLMTYLKPSPTAYSHMQRMVTQYCPTLVDDIKDRFVDLELPIHGFKSEDRKINILKLIGDNKDWLFSGIGLAVLLGLFNFFLRQENTDTKTIDNNVKVDISVPKEEKDSQNTSGKKTIKGDNGTIIEGAYNNEITINNFLPHKIDDNDELDTSYQKESNDVLAYVNFEVKTFKEVYLGKDFNLRNYYIEDKKDMYLSLDLGYLEYKRLMTLVYASGLYPVFKKDLSQIKVRGTYDDYMSLDLYASDSLNVDCYKFINEELKEFNNKYAQSDLFSRTFFDDRDSIYYEKKKLAFSEIDRIKSIVKNYQVMPNYKIYFDAVERRRY